MAANLDSYRAKQRDYYAANKDKRASYHKKWRKENSEKIKDARLRKEYGISLAERDALLASQGGVCGVCRSDNAEAKRDWHVDHCHATGNVRGVLCHHCNTLLGLARDNPDILTAGIRYLAAHEALNNGRNVH